MEQAILSGTEEQRESWQTTIVTHEATGIPFNKFRPHDDWKPEQPKENEPPKEEHGLRGWFGRLYTPTENEKAAQEAVRNNPNIPEGAKP